METLQILEQKIIQLVTLVKELQEEVKTLKTENELLELHKIRLSEELEEIKTSHITEQTQLEEEKALARLTIDEIIKNIDSLVTTSNTL